jgi:hypothetical protein
MRPPAYPRGGAERRAFRPSFVFTLHPPNPMDPMIDALSERIALIHFLTRRCGGALDPATLARRRDQLGRVCRECMEEIARHRIARPRDGALLDRLADLVRLMESRAGHGDDDDLIHLAQQAILSELRLARPEFLKNKYLSDLA